MILVLGTPSSGSAGRSTGCKKRQARPSHNRQLAFNQADDHKRVFDVTSLYLRAIRALSRKDTAIDVTVCIVPEIIHKNCRPLSKVAKGTGKRPSAKEVKPRRQTADLFGEYDPAPYDFSLDFRRQIKARAMECKMPIQIVRESTLNLSDERPPWGAKNPYSAI
jgi:hypothetical protein